MRYTLIFLLLLAGCSPSSESSTRTWSGETGFLDRNVTVDSTSFRYQVYLPRDYTPDRDWPLIVFLHGAGERGGNGMMQTQVGLAPALRLHPERWPAVVIFPQLPAGGNWNATTEPLAMKALEQATAEFSVNPDRVYLTGLSMGGYGSLFLGSRHPELFAALVPVCPSVGHFQGYPFLHGADLASSLQGTAEAVQTLPVWLFHGEEDPVFPVEISSTLRRHLDSLGASVRFTSYPGTGHNAWDAAYADTSMIAWLFDQKRPS